MSRMSAKTAVHGFAEGGFMVRGTTDPTEAIRLAVEDADLYEMEDMTAELAPWDADRVTFGRMLTDEELEEVKATAAHYFARLLANARVGWLRISPCHAGCGEHAWHWDTATGPGRGNFEGVVFDA